MQRLLMILALLAAASALGAHDVTVKLNDVSPKGTHTNIWFVCTLTIHNGTGTSLFVTNLWSHAPGLALKISDSGGKEFQRVYAAPWKIMPSSISPGDGTIKLLYGFGAWNGGRPSLSLPDGLHTVKVQVEGTLSSSSYTNRLTSNVVEVQVP